MKKLSALILTALLVLTAQPVFAAGNSQITDVEYFDDGSYCVTIIEDANDFAAPSIQLLDTSKTETKSKTAYHKDSSGNVMWYVRVTGTFTYDGDNARCISSTPSAKSQSGNWKVSNISGNESGNKATGSATGKRYNGTIVVQTISKTVTLTCSSTGVFS